MLFHIVPFKTFGQIKFVRYCKQHMCVCMCMCMFEKTYLPLLQDLDLWGDKPAKVCVLFFRMAAACSCLVSLRHNLSNPFLPKIWTWKQLSPWYVKSKNSLSTTKLSVTNSGQPFCIYTSFPFFRTLTCHCSPEEGPLRTALLDESSSKCFKNSFGTFCKLSQKTLG